MNLRFFYARRALRILPVYFAFLATLFVIERTTPFSMDRRTWIGDLTFTADLLGSSNWTSGHLWSLAVEEQFYLVWPAIFIATRAHERIRNAGFALMAPILICPLLRVAAYLKLLPGHIYSGAFSFDTIAIGCAAALLLFHFSDRIGPILKSKLKFLLPVGFLLILVPYALTKLYRLGMFTIPLGEPVQAIGFCILLLAGITNPQRLFFPALQWRWLVWMGVLSYSIYIWQMIFCTKAEAYGLGPVFWLSFPCWMLSAVLAASASFYLLERPLFALRRHFRP